MVTDQQMAEPLLGQPILEGLGLNARYLLAAAADCFSGSVDVESLL